jgi:predicted ATPase/class 3 adenylate cyclase
LDTNKIICWIHKDWPAAGNIPWGVVPSIKVYNFDIISPLPMNANRLSGTVTFLFTDIDGSTQLWEQYPDAMKTALAKHDSILKEAILANHGEIVKTTGDGVHAVFTTALDGITAAVVMQRGLLSISAGLPLRVRMGLHTAEAELRDGDYYGQSLNRAARIMSIGHGGQILLSETTVQVVREHLPRDYHLLELGVHFLKGLTRPEKITQLVVPDLPKDFPPLNSIPTATHNLPLQLTSFIGREKEIAEIKALLASSRLVTLTGSGGTGKTRLSIEVGTQELAQFTNGVWMIELAPLSDPAQIIPALAQAFGLQETPFSTIETLVTDHLRDKKLLLILDNCEHLIAACASLADQLLHQCAGLKILASSREALGIGGEMAYRTPSLADSESTRLFIERARAANANVSLTAANAAAVAQICLRLDGIPLAIELAAARTKLLSVDQIAARLDDRFKLLTGGSRTALPRQQTLRALIDWSYDMLSQEERALLRRLSVFASGWTFEAAEFVCPNHDVLELLTQLVNKSLVVVDNEDSQSTRYRLLETIRQYARDKLFDAGEAFEVRTIHSQYYLQVAEAAEPHLYQADSGKLIGLLENERDNFRVTLEWTTANDIETALRIVYALQLFWIRNGFQAEGRILTEAVIASAEALPPLQGQADFQRKFLIARALSTLVVVTISQGDIQYARQVSAKCEFYARGIGNQGLVARALSYSCIGRLSTADIEGVEIHSREALQCARASDDPFALGLSLGVTSEFLMITGKDPEMAREYASQSTKILKEHGYEWAYALILLGIGMMAKYTGDFKVSRENLTNVLPLFQKMGDIQRVMMIQSEFGHMQRYEGHFDKAEQTYRETIVAWQKIGHFAAVAHQLELFAFIAFAHGQSQRAARLFGAAEALREHVNIQMSHFERLEYDKQVAELRHSMDERALRDFWAEGRGMTTEQAVQFALES